MGFKRKKELNLEKDTTWYKGGDRCKKTAGFVLRKLEKKGGSGGSS